MPALATISLVILMGLVFPSISEPSDQMLPPVLSGDVVGISDGDTLTLLVDGDRVRIRLAQIDAPEMGQPYGKRAKAELSRLAFGKRARVEVVDVDRYGRTVGEVYVDGIHVNFEMVRQGHAWAYTRYARSTEIIDVAREARDQQLGLWALPLSERDAPWDWRHRRKQRRAKVTDDRCDDKRTCAEMENCAEARFYLSRCGMEALDGDRDGMPCESLCQ